MTSVGDNRLHTETEEQPSPTNLDNQPTSVQEVGFLSQGTTQESRFIGSSSGVYFINTVKQAFDFSARCTANEANLPTVEETVGGEDDFSSSTNPEQDHHEFGLSISDEGAILIDNECSIGSYVLRSVARRHAIAYFETWHPILPFLSGPDFIHQLEAFYLDIGSDDKPQMLRVSRKTLTFVVAMQCVLATSTTGSVSDLFAKSSSMLTTTNILSLTALLEFKHDAPTIQALLAAQVYCISFMALRTASTLSGILTKLLVHAGLHRCPHRYALSNSDCDLRKRIFWSYYTLDRYLCQALGLPLSLPDSDIDVCAPGKAEEHTYDLKSDIRYGAPQPASDCDDERRLPMATFVQYGRLLGQALEIFHKSIHVRQTHPRQVLALRAEMNKWYNGLPESQHAPNKYGHQDPSFLPFFNVLHEQLVITTHRPSLALPISSPEFQHGLQTAIQAAKRTIATLEREASHFWPGYLAAVWMSGLILAFACQLQMYSSTKAFRCV